MRVFKSPQVNEKMKIIYEFVGEVVMATIDETQDEFDFSVLPEGGVVTRKDIQTSLPICPIISARRTDGVLSVELLNFIGLEATEAERFPAWEEV